MIKFKMERKCPSFKENLHANSKEYAKWVWRNLNATFKIQK